MGSPDEFFVRLMRQALSPAEYVAGRAAIVAELEARGVSMADAANARLAMLAIIGDFDEEVRSPYVLEKYGSSLRGYAAYEAALAAGEIAIGRLAPDKRAYAGSLFIDDRHRDD